MAALASVRPPGALVWAVTQRFEHFEQRKSPVFCRHFSARVTAQTEASRGRQRLAAASRLKPHKVQTILITSLALERN